MDHKKEVEPFSLSTVEVLRILILLWGDFIKHKKNVWSFWQHEIRGRRQWQDVLVDQDLKLHVFLSHVAQLVGSVNIRRNNEV